MVLIPAELATVYFRMDFPEEESQSA